jgi:hypothetical protein
VSDNRTPSIDVPSTDPAVTAPVQPVTGPYVAELTAWQRHNDATVRFVFTVPPPGFSRNTAQVTTGTEPTCGTCFAPIPAGEAYCPDKPCEAEYLQILGVPPAIGVAMGEPLPLPVDLTCRPLYAAGEVDQLLATPAAAVTP